MGLWLVLFTPCVPDFPDFYELKLSTTIKKQVKQQDLLGAATAAARNAGRANEEQAME